MKIPVIKGIIDRRILINYQVDREVLNDYLPKPFKPKLVNGKGIAGICLIRLKGIRPKGLPKQIGISSENGAHRIAVEWEENGTTKNWKVSLLDVESVRSSFFEDEHIFPRGTVKFDNALLMKNIEHEWIGLKKIRTIDKTE